MPIPASAQPARAAEPCTVVIFGASGDLTQRKLVPALYNLRHDGLLWKWRTWKGAWSFAFGKRGIVRLTYGTWRRYFRPDFHPNQLHTDASRNWLAAHADQFTPVSVTPA